MDGVALTGHPFDPVANPAGADVPIMVGCTSDEQTLYNVGFDWWGIAEASGLELVPVDPGRFGQVLLNDILACEGPDGPRPACLADLETVSKAAVPFVK